MDQVDVENDEVIQRLTGTDDAADIPGRSCVVLQTRAKGHAGLITC
jgi:hypothetical protein